MEEQNGGFWGVLPAIIRHSNKVGHLSKVIYAEITALSNQKGYCWATNAHFEDLFDVSHQTVSKCITELVDAGFLNVEDRSGRVQRKLHPVVKFEHPPASKVADPLQVDLQQKNIIEEDNIKDTPLVGKNPLSRIVNVYSTFYKELYGNKPTTLNWGRWGKTLKPLLALYSEDQISAMLVWYFKWHGMSGSDGFIHKKLAERAFPLEWLPNYADNIVSFAKNVDGVDFTDPQQVAEVINTHILSKK